MAFSGLHVTCGYAGSTSARATSPSLLGKLEWSQTFASAGITTNAAPGLNEPFGNPVMQVRSTVDAWVAVGSNPDASQSPRIFVPANEFVPFYVQAGDKLAWIEA